MNESFDKNDFVKYFSDVSEGKIDLFKELSIIHQEINKDINVISKNDIEHLYVRHILYSLSIAKIYQFMPGEKIVDVGTGGGFPGIPLAILFPDSNFTLIDSIGKKIAVVQEIIRRLKLSNVSAVKVRSIEFKDHFNCVTGRAVTAFPEFYKQVKHLIQREGKIIYLKGGDFQDETRSFRSLTTYEVSDFFPHNFFKTKKIIYFLKK